MNNDYIHWSALIDSTIELPAGIQFYSIDAQIVFPIRSMEGNIEENLIIYLVRPGDLQGKGWYKYGIEFSSKSKPADVLDLIEKSISKFVQALAENKALTYNPDGGDLGRGDNENSKD